MDETNKTTTKPETSAAKRGAEGDLIDNLRTVRDEIRVKMHLAEMDARDWWEGIEARLADVEHQLARGIDQAGDYADIVGDELAKALRRVSARLDQRKH